jgi:energy-coupling factor transport system ATP-binding protein
MEHKTFLGLYRKSDIIPLEIKFLVMLGLCTFYALDGFIIAKTIILTAMLCACLYFGRLRSLRLIRALVISSIILIFFWTIFVQKISFSTIFTDFLVTIKSQAFIRAIFRLFGLIIPGQLFMSLTSEYELLSTLKRYHAKPELTIFFVVAFNTIAHFISAYQTITFGYTMRVVRKQNIMNKLVRILTTLLFNCILLITKTKKIYFLYEDRIKQSILSETTSVNENNKIRCQSLEINILNVKYENTDISCLKAFQTTISVGQKTLLVGDIGTGKTTLLNIISGIIPNIINCEFTGHILLDGKELQSNDIDYVFQHSENSMFYDTVDRQLSHIDNDSKVYWLERFFMDDLLHKAIADLSIGQKKILSIMSCLLSNASICLLDEPTAHLDDNAINVFLDLLENTRKEKIVIVASHDQDIRRQFDNIILISAVDSSRENKQANAVLISPANNALVNVRNCSYIYPDGTEAFCNISFEVRGGEIIGLLGSNGSGKSTVGRLLAESAVGIYKNASIQVVNKCTIAVMLQDADLQFFTTSVSSEVQFGVSIDNTRRNRVDNLLSIFNLTDYFNEPPQFLSEGQKKLLLVICMVLSEPDILILDEPFDSLDANNRELLRIVLLKYMEWVDGKKSLIINDQNEREIGGIATKIVNLPTRERYSPKLKRNFL